jgi:DNA-binding phage protein
MTYEQFLDQVVDDIFNEASKRYTWQQLADKAGVSHTTVYRLGMRITRLPQLRTIFLLAKAAGLDVKLLKKKLGVFRQSA